MASRSPFPGQLQADNFSKFVDLLTGDIRRSREEDGDISALYNLPTSDQTGVLLKHKQKMLQPFSDHQVDMKIMYYELIKMLMDYDKRQQSEEEYFVTNTIHKIEGYQQLTNKVTENKILFQTLTFLLHFPASATSQQKVPD